LGKKAYTLRLEVACGQVVQIILENEADLVHKGEYKWQQRHFLMKLIVKKLLAWCVYQVPLYVVIFPSAMRIDMI